MTDSKKHSLGELYGSQQKLLKQKRGNKIGNTILKPVKLLVNITFKIFKTLLPLFRLGKDLIKKNKK